MLYSSFQLGCLVTYKCIEVMIVFIVNIILGVNEACVVTSRDPPSCL